MSKIAVLGANSSMLPFCRQAKALGFTLIGIATPGGAVCEQYFDKFYPISFAEKEQVLEICRQEQVDGIVPFCLETSLPTVAYVAKELGLVGNTMECVERTATKFAQRAALEEAGLPVPKYRLIQSDDLRDLQCSFPVIVKPDNSGGSQGVSKVDRREDLKEAYEYASEKSRTGKVIVEEFVGGREFSVEYISHGGRHYFLQLTDKVTSGAPRFAEMQHHQPANVSDDVLARIKAMVEKALTALKIENSPSHTEIKLDDNGRLFIIETGARMGGDYITSDLVRLSTGYDFVDGAVKLAIGRFEKPRFPERKFSGVFFYNILQPEVGEIIKNRHNYPEIVQWEYSESPLPEIQSNSDRGGFFIYQSDKKFNG